MSGHTLTGQSLTAQSLTAQSLTAQSLTAQTLIGGALVLVGTLLVVVAAIGMLRLWDIYNRTNAVAKAAALGVSCVLAGVAVLTPSALTITTVVLSIAAQLLTAPIAGHAVGRAAYRSGAPLTGATQRDDLAARDTPDA